MKLPAHIFHKGIFSCFIFFLSFHGTNAAAENSPKPGSKNVLILEVRGMTYEMLERAYVPNIKFLIKNGFLGSIEARDVNETPASRPGRVNIRRLLGRMVSCYDSLKVFQSSMNTVGVFSDTIRGPFSLQRKNYRSNESMVRDFVNSSNGSNVQFSFLSFRTFTPKNTYLDREQINELTTIDSLIGIVFKSYQEKVKWDQTTVMLITDGSAGHKYQDNDIFKNTPIIIKGPGIPTVHDINRLLTNNELMALAGSILGPDCNDSIIPPPRNFFHEIDTTQDPAAPTLFVNRPDILIYPVQNRNQINVEFLADNEAATVFYTLDGTNPVTSGIEYKTLVPIKEAGVYTIRAATKLGEDWSAVTIQTATLRNNLQSIEIDPMPDQKYTFSGADELVDGDTASLGFAAEKWLGFQGKDVTFTFNFGGKREIHSVDISALQDYDSWIFLPKKVSIWVGDDKGQMVEVGSQTHISNKDDEKNIRKHFVFPITDEFILGVNSNLIKKKKKKKFLNVRYLMVKVEASKTAPEWFSLPGAQLWFFTDEIKIE